MQLRKPDTGIPVYLSISPYLINNLTSVPFLVHLIVGGYDINSQKLNAIFYKTDSGNEPVREWLKNLIKVDKKTIGEDIKTVQYG